MSAQKSVKNYKITIGTSKYGFRVQLYHLFVRPIYEIGKADPVRHEDEWIKSSTSIDTETYLGARWEAWKLKYKIQTGGLLPGGEKTIYERKG